MPEGKLNIDPDLIVLILPESTKKRYFEIVSVFEKNNSPLSKSEKLNIIDNFLINIPGSLKNLEDDFQKIVDLNKTGKEVDEELFLELYQEARKSTKITVPVPPSSTFRLGRTARNFNNEYFDYLAKQKLLAEESLKDSKLKDKVEFDLSEFNIPTWRALSSLNLRQLTKNISALDESVNITFDEFHKEVNQIFNKNPYLFSKLCNMHRFGYATDIWHEQFNNKEMSYWEDLVKETNTNLTVGIGHDILAKYVSGIRGALNTAGYEDAKLVMRIPINPTTGQHSDITAPIDVKELIDNLDKSGDGKKENVLIATFHGNFNQKLEHYISLYPTLFNTDASKMKSKDLVSELTANTKTQYTLFLDSCLSAMLKCDIRTENIIPGTIFVVSTSFYSEGADKAYQVDTKNFFDSFRRNVDVPTDGNHLMQTYLIGLKNQVPPELIYVNSDKSISICCPGLYLQELLQTGTKEEIVTDKKTIAKYTGTHRLECTLNGEKVVFENSKISQEDFNEIFPILKKMRIKESLIKESLNDINRASRPSEMAEGWSEERRRGEDYAYGVSCIIAMGLKNGFTYEDSQYPQVKFNPNREISKDFLENNRENLLFRSTEVMRLSFPDAVEVQFNTPMHDQFDELLKYKSSAGDNAYHVFCSIMNNDVLLMIKDKMNDKECFHPDIDAKNNYGSAPIHTAILSNASKDDLKIFIDNFSDILNKKITYGPERNGIFYLLRERWDLMELMEEKGFDPFQENLNRKYAIETIYSEATMALKSFNRKTTAQLTEKDALYIESFIYEARDDINFINRYIKLAENHDPKINIAIAAPSISKYLEEFNVLLEKAAEKWPKRYGNLHKNYVDDEIIKGALTNHQAKINGTGMINNGVKIDNTESQSNLAYNPELVLQKANEFERV